MSSSLRRKWISCSSDRFALFEPAWVGPPRGRSHGDRDAEEGCGNGGGVIGRACVLGAEEGVQLSLKIGLAAVGRCGFERVHRWSVVRPEETDKFRWCARVVEGVG